VCVGVYLPVGVCVCRCVSACVARAHFSLCVCVGARACLCAFDLGYGREIFCVEC